ncbi:low molecular weight phosphatase family protein [Mycobacterium sp. smrl_JER01]|uniref:arsenate reductase/protein-tyrosine-phosphatase family protein n=1 Tax=Mycobacterium sp. smrl_JER01 TaxID=3402633 RepID=UPI003ACD0934
MVGDTLGIVVSLLAHREETAVHVLFVCTGNICRSPTAERLAVAYAAERGWTSFLASSAGTRAVVNHGVHGQAALVLESLGGDAAGFVARQLNSKIASVADLILTMTRAHRDEVLEMAPHKLSRTFTLREASRLTTECGAQGLADLSDFRSQLPANDELDVSDPIGEGTAVFEAVGSQIACLLPPVMELCRDDDGSRAV